MSQTSGHVRYMAIAALLAAMVTVSIVVFRIPLGMGIVHIGDAMIYLAAVLLPKPYALAVAAIGGATANIVMGLPQWAPATFIIKPLLVIWFTSKGKIICPRNTAALFIAWIVNTSLYYVYAGFFIYGSPTAPNWVGHLFTSLWGGVAQSGGSAIVFLLMAAAFDRMDLKKRLRLGTN